MIEIIVFLLILLIIERVFHKSTFGIKHGRASWVDHSPPRENFVKSNARGIVKDIQDLRRQVRENIASYEATHYHTDIFSGHTWRVVKRYD